LAAIPGFIKLTSKRKEQILLYDDLNGDGKWNEEVLLYTFHPKEKVTFSIAQGPSNITGHPK
jgi:hypothetical protein